MTLLIGLVTSAPVLGDCPGGPIVLRGADIESNHSANDSVAIDGDVAVVAAPWGPGDGIDPYPGAVYIFRFDGAGWVEEARLDPPDPIPEIRFGSDVAVSGDVVLVSDHSYLGNVSVFRFDPESYSWIHEADLIGDDSQPGDEFGYALSIDGDVALIGAPYDYVSSPGGSAYVFRYDDQTGCWLQEAKLTAASQPDFPHQWRFGLDVAMRGGVAVIGTPGQYMRQSGAAYVFRFDGVQWAEEAMLVSPAYGFDGRENFGWKVDIDGDTVVATAPFYPEPFAQGGAAFVFRHAAGQWTQEAELSAPDGDFDTMFGASVSIRDDLIAVGDPFDDHPPKPESGSVYVFERHRSTWSQVAKYWSLNPDDAFMFGIDVAVSENDIFIGVQSEFIDGEWVGAGVVYLRTVGPDDCNANGVPDACDDGVGDLDDDGIVGIVDLLILLAGWGPNDCCGEPPCPDLDGDGNVGIVDFLRLLAEWGPGA